MKTEQENTGVVRARMWDVCVCAGLTSRQIARLANHEPGKPFHYDAPDHVTRKRLDASGIVAYYQHGIIRIIGRGT